MFGRRKGMVLRLVFLLCAEVLMSVLTVGTAQGEPAQKSQSESKQTVGAKSKQTGETKRKKGASNATKPDKRDGKKVASKGKKTGGEAAKKSEVVDFKQSLEKLQTAYQKKQYASALVYCEDAMRSIPEETPDGLRGSIMMMCIELYNSNGQYENALALGAKINGMEVLQEMRDGVCFMEATTLTKLHRWADAEAQYSLCPGKDVHGRAVVESNVAELRMIQGDSEGAVIAYRESLNDYSQNPHAAYGLATALARTERWEEAREAFLSGLEMDPGFSFLDDAFFEPQAENDFQTGYRLFEEGRYREAKFYLKRYVQKEEREAYRVHGERFLERLDGMASMLEASYPVLSETVRAVGMDETGTKVVFALFERESEDEYESKFWTMDLESGRVSERLKLPGEIVMDVKFVPGTTNVRILTSRHRYECDFEHPEKGYLFYDNAENAFSLNLTADGAEIVSGDEAGRLNLSPWNNPYLLAPVVQVPKEVTRFGLSPSQGVLALTTSLKTLIVNVETDTIVKTLSAEFDVNSVAVHPAKGVFALGIQSGVLLIDREGRILGILGGLEAVKIVSFNASGDRIAAIHGQSLDIWNVSEMLERY